VCHHVHVTMVNVIPDHEGVHVISAQDGDQRPAEAGHPLTRTIIRIDCALLSILFNLNKK